MIDLKTIKLGDFLRYSPNSTVQCEVIALPNKDGLTEVEFVNDITGDVVKRKYKAHQLYSFTPAGVGERPEDDNVVFRLLDGTTLDTTVETFAFLQANCDYEQKNPNNFLGSDGRTPLFTYDRYIGMIPEDLDRLNRLKAKKQYETHYNNAMNNIINNS